MSTERPADRPRRSRSHERGHFINGYVSAIYGTPSATSTTASRKCFWEPAWGYLYDQPDMCHSAWVGGMIDLCYDRIEPYMAMSIEELDAVIAVSVSPGTLATEPLFHTVCARACKEVP